MKKALLLFGMLALSCIGFAQVSQPISHLEVQVLDNDRAFLTWNLPNGCDTVPMTLSWITSETNDGGSTQAGFDDIFGHLYNSSDLRSLVGWSVDTISFYKTTLWTYRICVWKRPDGESMQLIYSQLAQINDSIMAAWCDIPLDTTILVEEHTDYWFGVRATREEGQTGPFFPIPFDRGPAVTGKGDLFMPDLVHWTPMQIGYNAMIKATLSNSSRKGKQSNEQEMCSGYRIYRDGSLIKEIPYGFVTYFTDTEFTRETDVEYCVTAMYGEEESESVCATAIITGIGDTATNDDITVLPNPTNGLILIEGATVAEVLVYNTIGQLVKTVQNTNEIDMCHLPEGIYFLRITAKDGRLHVGKITVSK